MFDALRYVIKGDIADHRKPNQGMTHHKRQALGKLGGE
jgi:hypothetical protein